LLVEKNGRFHLERAGSGTLKKAIREHLKENFYVKDFISGGRDGRSDGVTIVEL